jgi:hypothetical protein
MLLPSSTSFSSRCRLVDERHDDTAARRRCADHGDLAARQTERFTGPLRSGQPIHQRAVAKADGGSRHHLFQEPIRRFLGQRCEGEQSFFCFSYQVLAEPLIVSLVFTWS